MSHKRGTVNPENGSKWWLFVLNQRLDHLFLGEMGMKPTKEW
jgi:hypothetical protein